MTVRALVAICALFLCSCTAYVRESEFIEQDNAVVLLSPEDIAAFQTALPAHKVRSLELQSSDSSTRLRGLYLDNPDSETLLFFIPGNGMSIANSGSTLFPRLAELSVDVVFFDRRGLGASEGTASTQLLSLDARDTLKFVRDELGPEVLVVHGYSMGSFVAGYLAETESIDALVFEGAATNVTDWIDRSTPWYVKPFLTVEVDEGFYRFDNKRVVSERFHGPLLVIAAGKDELVPVSLSEDLYAASASENKRLVVAAGAGHGDMLKGAEEIRAYREFLGSLSAAD